MQSSLSRLCVYEMRLLNEQGQEIPRKLELQLFVAFLLLPPQKKEISAEQLKTRNVHGRGKKNPYMFNIDQVTKRIRNVTTELVSQKSS